MRLARRIALLLGSLAAAILAATAVVDLQESWAREREDISSDHRLLARVLSSGFEHSRSTDGLSDALAFLDEANTELTNVKVRWIWLDTPRDAQRTPWPPSRLQRLKAGEVTSLELEEPPRRLTLRAIDVDGRLGAIEIAEQLSRREDRMWVLAVRTAAATLALAALFFIAAVAIGRRLVGKPTEALVRMARDLSAGKLDSRAQLATGDELAELGGELNSMADALRDARRKLDEESRARLAALEELRHAERLSTVGKLAAGVAHELGTPLTVIDGHAREISLAQPDHPVATNSVRVIREQVRNMTRIIRQLLGFARRSLPSRRDEPLKPIADRTLEVLFPLAAKKGVHLLGHVPESLQAHIDAAGVQQVLTNLVLNGIQATPSGGEVEVTAERVQREAPGDGVQGPHDWVRLDVLDTGIGLTDAVRPHLFEPFFTTKGVGEGTGLGLSVSYGIVRDHGGFIEAEPRASGGTRFSVFLP